MPIYSDRDIITKHKVDFVISPFEKGKVTPLGYDISAEHALLISPDGKSRSHSNEKIEMPPNSMAVLIAKENVWLSTRVAGILHSRGSLSARGLILNSTTVDPQWSGRMIFCIHNASPFKVNLNMNEPVITLVLNQIGNQPRNPPATNPFRVIHDHYIHVIPDEINKFISNASDLTNPDASAFLADTHRASRKGLIGRKISVYKANFSLYPARAAQKILVVMTAAFSFILILEKIFLLYLEHLGKNT